MPCDADCATASTAVASSFVVALSGSGFVYPGTEYAVGVVWNAPVLSGTGSSACALGAMDPANTTARTPANTSQSRLRVDDEFDMGAPLCSRARSHFAVASTF